jgi:hypothetical protein
MRCIALGCNAVFFSIGIAHAKGPAGGIPAHDSFDVRVEPNGQGRGRPAAVELTLTNHPIIGPIFSG